MQLTENLYEYRKIAVNHKVTLFHKFARSPFGLLWKYSQSSRLRKKINKSEVWDIQNFYLICFLIYWNNCTEWLYQLQLDYVTCNQQKNERGQMRLSILENNQIKIVLSFQDWQVEMQPFIGSCTKDYKLRLRLFYLSL